MDRQPVPEAKRLDPRALPRFFVAPEVLEAGLLPEAVAHQVHRVLRLREGDTVCLLDGQGHAHIVELTGKGRFRALHRQPLPTEPSLQVVVLQALIRHEKLELAIRLCVQAGASALWVAPSARSLVKLDSSKLPARQERWQKIATEEAELAYRAFRPQIRLFEGWHEAYRALPRPVLILDEWESSQTLPALINRWRAQAEPLPATLSLVVGPEGGFASEERAQMHQAPETYPVSLGARVLRTETAGFYALAQLWAILDEGNLINPAHHR